MDGTPPTDSLGDYLRIWDAKTIREEWGRPQRPIDIAIVGNGPVEEDSVWMVDKADIVVRFNNWASRGELKQWVDIVGGRCDIMVGNFDIHTTNMGEGDVSYPKQAVLGIPYPHRWDTADQLADRYRLGGGSMLMVNPFWNRDLCALLGYQSDGTKHPLPTVGLTAIYHLWRMTQLEIEPLWARFYVCGFTWHYDEADDTIQKFPIESEGLPKHFNHWYALEAWWIANLLYGSPGWQFSPLAAKTMERLDGREYAWTPSLG